MTTITADGGGSGGDGGSDGTTSRITELAAVISSSTAAIERYLRERDLPPLSFDADAPANFGFAPDDSKEVEGARRRALEAAAELQDLLTPPSALLRPPINATALQFIYRYEIPAKVPVGGTATFAALAEQCGVPEPDVRRLLRYAMVHHRVFREPAEGVVAHTAASRLLVDSSQEWDMAGLTYEEDWPAFARTVDAMQKWGDAEPNHTGHNLAFSHSDTFFGFLSSHPEESRRFHNAVSLFANPGPALAHLASAFDWAGLPAGSLVVDVGGGTGSASVHLAQTFPDLTFEVQDTPDAVAGQAEKLRADLRGRVRFTAHDFFEPQTSSSGGGVSGGGGDGSSEMAEAKVPAVFLLRAVLHNWPDRQCVRILRGLRPGLRRGGRVVVNDGIMPRPGEPGLLAERNVRAFDLTMMTLFNAREREEADWRALAREADPGFAVVGVVRPPVGTMGLVVLEWTGGD